MKYGICAAVAAFTIMLTGCGKTAPKTTAPDYIWAAYWDQDAAALEKSEIRRVGLFAANFDENGSLYVQEDTLLLAQALRDSEKKRYLTVVNDITREQGENSLKDTEILYNLLSEEDRAREHTKEIVRMAKDCGCDGVEIDYECIRKDMTLWAYFMRFLTLLQEEAGDLAVRVVLEPGTPVEELSFPEGPEYVVMCYNLHYPGTEPGPKADRAFLLELKERFSSLPNVGFALANGGYSWGEDGMGTSLTTAQAEALAEEEIAKPIRDQKSGAVHFQYKRNGETVQVWYGDDQTLRHWASILNEDTPASVSIWYHGG